MAYNQSNYQPPQRPLAGRPPPQRQGPPPQQYPPQQYDQYANNGHGYGDYNGGYGQDYNGNSGYQDMNGGGRGNGYPPQNKGYPPQQDYYGNDGAGRGMPPPNRGRGGQRPPPPDGNRNPYDQRGGGQARGGYANGGSGMGRGGRPAPMQRSASSDPGSKAVRKPLKTPPLSPDVAAWDNPFPNFPGTKQKTSLTEEQNIINQMTGVDLGGPRSKASNGRGFPNDPRIPTDDFGLPVKGQSQQGPQQGYEDQRRGPPGPAQGFGGPRQNGYGERGYDDRGGYGGDAPISPMREGFSQPPRSMTMPNKPGMGPGAGRQAPISADGPGPSAPYNGPIGRSMPPRPSTATGTRPSMQNTYQNQGPSQQQYPNMDSFSNGNGANPSSNPSYASHKPEESISDFYDSYYDTQSGQQSGNNAQASGPEASNFDDPYAAPRTHRRGGSMDGFDQRGHGGYPQPKPTRSQTDFRARAQPQAAMFEMAGDAPPLPNGYHQQGYPEDNYSQNRQYGEAQGYGGYGDTTSKNEQLPPRSTSVATRPNETGLVGLPSGPKSGFVGTPGGPGPLNGARSTTQNSDPLPSHPPPVRAGLIPNSVASQAINKPPPVRNYSSPGAQPAPSPQPAVPEAAPNIPPVTTAELEQLKNMVKNNPNDQPTQLLLARKLIEASEVIVPTIPDQRARTKAREKYIMDAHKQLKKLVAVQNADAMFYLADCYGRGSLGLETDTKEAFSLYQSAAKAGHAAAAYRTAVCCELGNDEGGGTRKDPLKAIQWYKRAAMLGDTPAMYKMGMIQLKGLLGQPKNPREAVNWLQRAAERADAENPHAVHELGLLYQQSQQNDNSLLRDEAYALSLFKRAADLGYKFSQFRLGCTYEYGLLNCQIDPRQSIMWYSKAAVQEEHQSELALSGWYLTGSEGVLQQSDTEAYLWARKAAMAGLAKAEYAMGYFTEVGIGAPASLEDAKRWYWRAAAQNFPKARERLEDLKRGGSKPQLKSRERISRSKVGKQNEGECNVM